MFEVSHKDLGFDGLVLVLQAHNTREWQTVIHTSVGSFTAKGSNAAGVIEAAFHEAEQTKRKHDESERAAEEGMIRHE